MNHNVNWIIPKGKTDLPNELLNLGLSPLLSAVLQGRGFSERGEVSGFLDGKDLLSDPYILSDVDKAVNRIKLAAINNENVAVFGDYDVDGITSACLMSDYLKRHLNINCFPYIPDRISEGYGLNCNAVEKLAGMGVSLIITVDCGITGHVETEFAATLGVDMIISDHHECRETLPNAIAVINPKREVDSSLHMLAGVGVAFKLVCALHGDSEQMLEEYSDLVAVGTVADVMPLVGENRTIVKYGLEKISRKPRIGLSALLNEASANNSRITSTTIGFVIAPRLNAAGRLGCAYKAANLLMEIDEERAKEMAKELCSLNEKRRKIEQDIWVEAQEAIADKKKGEAVVLAAENWHQGVVGIVASRISENYLAPTVMISLDGEKGKGSCRSCVGFNIFDALNACSEYLDGYGGHALAAGLSISKKNIEPFKLAFANYFENHPPTELAVLNIDLRIDNPELLSVDGVRSLDLLEPCGNGNPRPRMCILAATLENIIPMGGGKHLKLSVKKRGVTLECVYFSHSAEELGLKKGDFIDIAFNPQINEFRSRISVQLVLSDVRKHDPLPLCRRVLQGKLPQYGEAPEIYPERRDFATLWRGLEAQDGKLTGNIKNIFNSLEKIGGHAPKLFACMAVFEETGLIKIKYDDDYITVTQMHTGEKANLFSSQYFNRLAECAGT